MVASEKFNSSRNIFEEFVPGEEDGAIRVIVASQFGAVGV